MHSLDIGFLKMLLAVLIVATRTDPSILGYTFSINTPF